MQRFLLYFFGKLSWMCMFRECLWQEKGVAAIFLADSTSKKILKWKPLAHSILMMYAVALIILGSLMLVLSMLLMRESNEQHPIPKWAKADAVESSVVIPCLWSEWLTDNPFLPAPHPAAYPHWRWKSGFDVWCGWQVCADAALQVLCNSPSLRVRDKKFRSICWGKR